MGILSGRDRRWMDGHDGGDVAETMSMRERDRGIYGL